MAKKAATKRKSAARAGTMRSTRATRNTRSASNERNRQTTRGGSGRSVRVDDSGTLLKVLENEHRQVKQMLKDLVNAEDASEREEIFGRLKPELEAHSHGEEEAFYPLLKKEKESKTTAIGAYVEHHIAERLIQEMDAMDTGDEEWEARAKVLKDVVEHHIEEEESEIWKEARKLLGREKLAELTPDYMAAKERYL
jgi:hemerythrin-like domain-containing protein